MESRIRKGVYGQCTRCAELRSRNRGQEIVDKIAPVRHSLVTSDKLSEDRNGGVIRAIGRRQGGGSENNRHAA